MSQPEGHYHFFVEASKIIHQAQCLAQLEAVRVALHHLDDGLKTPGEQEELISMATHFILTLEALYEDPTQQNSMPLPTQSTGRPGKPSIELDLELAIHLHDLSNTWQEVADALGCSR
ncbi:hypothetical protein M422DRAFT_245404 [Sphaerobolus stellatus SS14]|nr:hypothetical protein M422DRAFT_245404 [Sphaerobolus stellatus SS14]